MNENFPSFHVTPPVARLVVGLPKLIRGREYPTHMCCGSSLGKGMLVRFKTVDFPGKGGVMKKAVEVWSDLSYHAWLGDSESVLFPSPPLSPDLSARLNGLERVIACDILTKFMVGVVFFTLRALTTVIKG